MIPDSSKKNKLIVIGNGFDLAHGYKTTYKDFLFKLFYDELIELENSLREGTYNNANPSKPEFYYRASNFNQVVTAINGFAVSEFSKQGNKNLYDKLINFIKAPNLQGNLTINFSSPLLSKLYSDLSIQNWVDVEETYYMILKNVVRGRNSLAFDQSHIKQISTANTSIEFLTNKLEIYLSVETLEKEHISDMVMKFKGDQMVKDIIILNFNYTNTFEQYFHEGQNYEVINIHGELNNGNNPIIFGAGDENHSLYPEIVESNNDDLLKNIKSLKYLETDNYQKLIALLGVRNKFDVDIIGHSCGISDRTLLKEIFNMDNCNKINIHHHNGLDSYRQSVYGISRYFDNNTQMRKKVNRFDEKMTIPQR